MTRDEMIARAVQMRSRDLFGQVTKEELAGLEAFQKKIEIPVSGDSVPVYEITPKTCPLGRGNNH